MRTGTSLLLIALPMAFASAGERSSKPPVASPLAPNGASTQPATGGAPGRPGEAGSADERLRRLWVALGSADTKEAGEAVKAMVALGDRPVTFLVERFYPARVDASRVKQLIAKLDDARYAVRKEASDELIRLGRAALPGLKEALKQPKLSAGARTRIEGVVEVKTWAGAARDRRFKRAVQVLARIGTARSAAALARVGRESWFMWGKPVEGLRIRLRATKRVWRADETPILVMHAENEAKTGRSIASALGGLTLNIDGEWYRCRLDAGVAIELIVRPGRKSASETFALGRLERLDHRGKKRQLVRLAPGTHVIWARDPQDKAVPLLSNLVVIEVAAATAPAVRPGSPQATQPASGVSPGRPAAGEPGGPAPAKKVKYDLRGGYRPGQKLLLIKEAQREYVSNVGGLSKSRYRVELDVSVQQPDAAGRLIVETTVRRVVLAYGSANGERWRDSAIDPPSPRNESRDPLKLSGGRVKITLDKAGKVLGKTMDAATIRRLNNAELVRNLPVEAVNLLFTPWMFMPDRPVAVGQTWTPDPKCPLYDMPTNAELLQDRTRCKLEEVRRTPAGRVAVIRVEGQGGETRGGDYGRPTFIGVVRYNLDTGSLLEHRYELNCNVGGRQWLIKMTTQLRSTQPAKPPPAEKNAPATRPAGAASSTASAAVPPTSAPKTAADVLAKMSAARRVLRSATYKIERQLHYVEAVHTDGRPPEKKKLIAAAGTRTQHTERFAVSGTKYRHDWDGTVPSHAGMVGLTPGRSSMAYDGKMERTYRATIGSGSLRSRPRSFITLSISPMFEFHWGAIPSSKVRRDALKLVGKRNWKGRPCYLLAQELGPMRTEFYVDPRRDWAVVSKSFKVLPHDKKPFWHDGTMGWYRAPQWEWETEITYKKDSRGLWLPAGWVIRNYSTRGKDRKLVRVHTAVVKEAKANINVPDSTFAIRFPDGTRVNDQERRATVAWDNSLSKEEMEARFQREVAKREQRDLARRRPTESRLKVGQAAPLFEARTIDGKRVRLADLRGKYVLLAFWDASCATPRRETPFLKAAHGLGRKDPRFEMVSVTAKGESTAKHTIEWVAKRQVKWTVTFAEPGLYVSLKRKYGVSNVGWVFLIGPDGKVIARNLRGDGIKAAVAKALSAATPPALEGASPDGASTQPATGGSPGRPVGASGVPESGPAKRGAGHDWHKERVTNIRGETLKQCIENLGNTYDTVLAMSSSSTTLYQGTYTCELHRVTHLFRVRRILAAARQRPGVVLPILRDTYKQSLAAWPAAYRSGEGPKGPTCTEVSVRVLAATYVLAESGDHASLRLLLKGFQTQQGWVSQWKRAHGIAQCPVPPVLTLYAMHRLVSTLPQDRLGPQARGPHKAYLAWAAKHLPEPKTVVVAGWKSDHDESDPYLRIADPKGVVLRDQPKMTMSMYPARFKDGTYFEGSGFPHLGKKETQWRDHLLKAVKGVIGEGTLPTHGRGVRPAGANGRKPPPATQPTTSRPADSPVASGSPGRPGRPGGKDGSP